MKMGAKEKEKSSEGSRKSKQKKNGSVNKIIKRLSNTASTVIGIKSATMADKTQILKYSVYFRRKLLF